MKTNAQKLKLINNAFTRLTWAFDSAWTNYAQALFRECLEEEKQHRTGDFTKYHPRAISANQAAKLFAVKRVAEYLNGGKLPEVKNYLHTQKSCFTAAAMVSEFGEKIKKEWAELPIDELAKLDYCDFVKAEAVE